MTDQDILNGLLAREGGYTDQRGDPGGKTIWGLSQAAQTELLGHPPTEAETRAITREQAAAFYRRKHVAPFKDIGDERLRVLAIDCSVLEGLPWTIHMLQELVGVPHDGILGPRSLTAIQATDARWLAKHLVRRRGLREIYTALSDVEPQLVKTTRLQDLAGWWNRLWAVGVEPL